MKRTLSLAIALAILAFSPASDAAPKKKQPIGDQAEQTKPKQTPTPTPTPTPQESRARGVLVAMEINNDGTIENLNIKTGAGPSEVEVKGCGAKLVNLPLLEWAFLNGQPISVKVSPQNCFMSFAVSPP